MEPNRPVHLRPLDAIQCRDALITLKEHGKCGEAEWPNAEFIVGNPPYLGSKEFLSGFGENYTQDLRTGYDGKVDPNMDYVTYWFYKAAQSGTLARLGFVATDQIRKGVNINPSMK